MKRGDYAAFDNWPELDQWLNEVIEHNKRYPHPEAGKAQEPMTFEEYARYMDLKGSENANH